MRYRDSIPSSRELPNEIRELGTRSRLYLDPGESGRAVLDALLHNWTTIAGIVGSNVMTLRKAAGLTREDLGLVLEAMTGEPWGQNKIGSLERGQWPGGSPYNLTLDQLYMLALIFQKSVIELLQVPPERRKETTSVVIGDRLADSGPARGFLVGAITYTADFFTSPEYSASDIARDLDSRQDRERKLIDQIDYEIGEPTADLKRLADALKRERADGDD